jgi:hypothetical protein
MYSPAPSCEVIFMAVERFQKFRHQDLCKSFGGSSSALPAQIASGNSNKFQWAELGKRIWS